MHITYYSLWHCFLLVRSCFTLLWAIVFHIRIIFIFFYFKSLSSTATFVTVSWYYYSSLYAVLWATNVPYGWLKSNYNWGARLFFYYLIILHLQETPEFMLWPGSSLTQSVLSQIPWSKKRFNGTGKACERAECPTVGFRKHILVKNFALFGL